MSHMVCVVSAMLNLSFCSHSRVLLCLHFLCADGSNRFRSPPAAKLTALASFHLLASFGWCWRIAALSTFPRVAF